MPTLGLARGVALYIGALVGPGLLFVPALAQRTAGPATIVAWLVLLVLCVPLAATFAGLAIRFPVAEGLAAYARAGFGERAGEVIGIWFLATVTVGIPANVMIGGLYVSDISGGALGALPAAVVIWVGVLAANAAGLRWSSGFQLLLSLAVIALVGGAVFVAVPARITHAWTPFAPHGFGAVGTAAAELIWMFAGWETMAQMAGEFRKPKRDLPRAAALTLALIAVLYVGVALANTVVLGDDHSAVSLSDLIGIAFGRPGRALSAAVAVALTAGASNVYVGSAAKLASALAQARVLPGWFADHAARTIPRAPLVLQALTGAGFLAALGAGVLGLDPLIRATAACTICVYVLALASAARILSGRLRVAALVALAMCAVVTVFSAFYLLIPALTALVALAASRWRARARTAVV